MSVLIEQKSRTRLVGPLNLIGGISQKGECAALMGSLVSNVEIPGCQPVGVRDQNQEDGRTPFSS